MGGNDANGIGNYVQADVEYLCRADDIVCTWHFKPNSANVVLDNLFLFLMSVSNGSVLAVVAEASCDVGLIGYEMAMLVSRTEATLTPQLISEMRGQLPVDGATRAPVG